MNDQLNLYSRRANKARTASLIGSNGERFLTLSSYLFGTVGLVLWLGNFARGAGYLILAVAVLSYVLTNWYQRDLKKSVVLLPAKNLDDAMDFNLLAAFKKNAPITPKSAWAAVMATWQGRFIANHLILDSEAIAKLLPDDVPSMSAVWRTASELVARHPDSQLDGAALATAILTCLKPAIDNLASLNVKPADVQEVYEWTERLGRFMKENKPYYGGIGRDWAAGFTPTLDRFGTNISRVVEAGGAHFHTLAHADILDSIIHNLSSGSGAVALVGQVGTGKSALGFALAERLLEGQDASLRYYQIFSLSASQILSSEKDQLEKIILSLFGEAARSHSSILFLDEARLFFGDGTGALDMGQILMGLLQNRQVKLIAAFTPDDYEHLKATNSALAGLFAAVIVSEPSPDVTLGILEDTALTIEARDKILVTYPALQEAIRLSGQYFQDQSYPGKAINLLEQALPYVKNKLMDAMAVQEGLEKTKGVKVTKVQAPEANILLHLEDRIHERMINQERAVRVIASALRRGRAGVANPSRPVGSFLFLGPTGVGKTELARSLAATYYGDEHQMIRLDMSEYQQPDDVHRLLSSGADDTKSLIISIREQPFSVVLLDEVEKAHPDVLNLLLQLLDEGQLTDQAGKHASFKNAIIICTSNAGSAEIMQRVAGGETLDNYERPLVDKLINQNVFKAELINRYDEVVLFRPLNEPELAQVAGLMLVGVNKTLANQNVSVQLTPEALAHVVHAGYDPQFGARPMRRVIQKMVENAVAEKILSGQAKPGSVIKLDVSDLGTAD